jgi:TolB-like protein/DNA-binding winged helix-turn-helix (wHTH) protein/Flp pilus assembly protein TadD
MDGIGNSGSIAQFGPFELDLKTGELRKSGLKIKLQEQPFQVLAMLLRHSGEVVTREELQKAVWPADTFVDFDRGLNKAVTKIREALGDSAESPRFVETLPRRGYRFIAPVDVRTGLLPALPSADAAPITAWRPEGACLQPATCSAGTIRKLPLPSLRLLGLVGLTVGWFVWRRAWRPGAQAAPGEISSLAVLPLENLSRDSEQEYFADGMTEELITDLGKIGALRVISRTSVMSYKGTRKPLSQIARELNVDGVVEGSVLRSGERVRITAQLLSANPERHLWAETYERDARDVLASQDYLARDIAREIRAKLTPQEQARLSSSRPVNTEAHEAYLRGIYFWNKRTEPDMQKSIEYFNLAIQKDSTYALAYAALGNAYNMLAIYGHAAPREVYPKTYYLAQRALILDASLAEAHAVLGFYKKVYEQDLVGSDGEFRRAIELNPGYALGHVWRGEVLSGMGRHSEALAELDRALELDPTSLQVSDQRGLVLYLARRYDAAIEQIRKTLELEPRFAHAHCWLGKAYLQKGLVQEGLAELQTAASFPGGDSPALVPWLGYAYALSGKRADAFRMIQTMKAREQKSFTFPYGVALIYCGLGEKERALAWLEKAYDERDPRLVAVKVEPALDPLRSDPHFQDLVRRIGLTP